MIPRFMLRVQQVEILISKGELYKDLLFEFIEECGNIIFPGESKEPAFSSNPARRWQRQKNFEKALEKEERNRQITEKKVMERMVLKEQRERQEATKKVDRKNYLKISKRS